MASDPGFYDVLGEDEPVGELPYPQEYDYLWTEERDALNLEWNPFKWFRRAEDRQGGAGIGLATAFAVGVVATAFAVYTAVGVASTGIILANSLLNPPEKPKLENDAMCGITTGGQASCVSFTRSNISISPFRTSAGGTA